MKKSNSIIWFEWFTKEKEEIFEQAIKNILPLSLRNGIAPTIFRKWLREEICKEVKTKNFSEKDLKSIENQWVQQKNISLEKFSKHRAVILKKCRMSEENLEAYCINELKAIKWSEMQWISAVEQIYLETKEDYDEVKLQMITLPALEKGLTLEIHQQLKESEISFEDVGKISSMIKYQSDPFGTWYKKTNLRKEILQALTKLKSGGLSAPFKISDNYTIIKLCQSRGTELTDQIKKRIISNQMASFIDYGVERLLDHISM